MSLKIADRIMETTNAAGLGDILLQGAFPGYKSFSSAFQTGDRIPYVISKGDIYEVGEGILLEGDPWTIIRDKINISSNSNNKINIVSGMRIFCDATKSYFDELGVGALS